MERIEALISKLREQFNQQADPNLLLGTVQLLQFELTKLKSNAQQSLGTPKVAVILPASNTVAAAGVSQYEAQYDKYALRPVEEVTLKEVKETILVDEGSVSVVQKNGQ